MFFKMFKKILVVVFGFMFSTQSLAFEMREAPSLNPGQSKLSLGGSILFGNTNPQANFSENPALNKARVYEENVRLTKALGDGVLKEMYVVMESKAFQSRQETVSGVVVHPSDSGWSLAVRSGGNFVHTNRFVLGGFFETNTPVIMDHSKFVNPAVNYLGGGFDWTFQLSSALVISQSAFLGSGLFLPRKQNPNIQGTTFVILNFGRMMGDKDFILKAGGVIESDLTSRIDNSYQQSTLADGRIKNRIFTTPFLLDIPFGQAWRLDGGYAMKWFGRSVRSSQFATFNLSKTF